MKLKHWAHLLTLVFVAAKLFGAVNWSWWVVFSPSLVVFGVAIFLILILGIVSLVEHTIE